MKARIKNLQIRYKSLNTAILNIEISKYSLQYLPSGNKPLMLEIKEYKKPRTRNANALMWELCEKLAERIPGISKEDVYRQAVCMRSVPAIQLLCQPHRLTLFQTVGHAEGLDGLLKQ